jgi:beta-phosphoglucomutase-like phosphatase (HAD superfamily)
MAKTTKTYEERIASKDERIQQLVKEKRKLQQQENARQRKARNNRLYRRHALLESYMPGLANLTDEQFYKFIKIAINTSYGRSKLAELLAEIGQSIDGIYVEMPDEYATGNGAGTPKAEPSGA